MSVTYKCWIGKPGRFYFEIIKLKNLIQTKLLNNNLILSTDHNSNYDWIGEPVLLSYFNDSKSKFGQICLLTSGTTGKPKEIWKDVNEIINNKRGSGNPKDIWLLTYNPARWAGLSVLLHVIKHNCQLIIPDDLSINNILNKINLVTHISLTPSLFRKLLMCNYEKMKSANLKQVTFGGEYATQKVLDDAKTLWPNARITHIYATTENGDICTCSDGKEGLPISKLKVPYSLSNDGELFLNNRSTEDTWKLIDDRLYFIGRKTEIINIGGAKISQFAIEKEINSITQINECKVFAISNALLGQIVGVDYVGNIEPLELKKILLAKLPKYAVPVKLNKVESIELTSAGKISRK